tara:strand:- start:62 stop:211 length:150 start_codon:yes stop_codon:yes gene_type:complete
MEAFLILGGLAIAFSFQLWRSLLSITWFIANKLRMSTEHETQIKASSSG